MIALMLAGEVPVPAPADFSGDNAWTVAIKAVLLLVYALVSVLFALWFERRLVGRMQQRLGPNVRGPLGLFQAIYDAMKLLLKEDMNVKRADKIVYIIAPMISVFASLLVMAVIPLGDRVGFWWTDWTTPAQLTDFPVAVLYILAVTAIGVYGIVLGGWSSRSTYSLLGSVRSTAQVISYELAMGMSLVTVFIVAGSMSTSQIVAAQSNLWFCVMLAPSLVLYVVSMVGETNRLPFDLPEAEGELVSGYMTEYSSMKFAWFFLAEYINMLNVSAVCTTLFLGGWRAPWPLSQVADGWLNTGWFTILWFLIKVWIVMFGFVWIRGTLVRFRYDQFMRLGWKVLIPAALSWIVILTIAQSVQEFGDRSFNRWFIPLISAFTILIVLIWFWPDSSRASEADEIAADGDGKAKAAADVGRDGVAGQAALAGGSDLDVIDPYADGFPVPPLPGQTLPASPRAARQGVVVAAGSPRPSDSGATSDGQEVASS